jgi:hypothetical protein
MLILHMLFDPQDQGRSAVVTSSTNRHDEEGDTWRGMPVVAVA